ncbi:MAG: hypothetical protein HY892_15290, partial [Deltaproteobacteria bacterium]|nr:hypothetical protein [Deltaproteobacteria bacterium]
MEIPDQAAPKIDAGRERARVRQIVIDQYLLHEVQHHSWQRNDSSGPAFRIPRAHSPVDLYKCLHQGEFGVGHTLDHPTRFGHRLLEELRQVRTGEAPREPVLEDISAGGQILRVNLRPFKDFFNSALEEPSTRLARVCFESAEAVRGSALHFWKTLALFAELNQTGEIILGGVSFVFPVETIDRFLIEVRDLTQGLGQIPVYGHSPAFHRLNQPAYRVVARTVLEKSPLSGLLERK